MCRLLAVRSDQLFNIQYHLEKFAIIAHNSKEYQGHGWGCAYYQNNQWVIYKNIKPIWKDDFSQFGKTKQLVVHARSAFQNEGIRVENNMPFYDGNYLFIFNGELRGVKIKENGRIGAEKIFNFINRFNNGDMKSAMEKGVQIIKKRTNYIRGMNIIISDESNFYVTSYYNEDSDYFTLHVKLEDTTKIICSEPYSNDTTWKPVRINEVMVI